MWRRLNGGTAAAFLALCRELKARTDEDLQHGVIARFHDESQLNRLVAESPQHFRILPPDYCTPEETPTGHEAILVLQKSRFIQIDASRTVKKPQSFPARKWEAFCLNWLPYLVAGAGYPAAPPGRAAKALNYHDKKRYL